MAFVYSFSELKRDDVRLAGGKGATLAQMAHMGIPVPNGFVIAATAYTKFFTDNGLNRQIELTLASVNLDQVATGEAASAKIQKLIMAMPLAPELEAEILEAYDHLGAEFVAVRSSATEEDSSDSSWAGQLDSFLNTRREQVLANIKKCWASLFSTRAIFYRFEMSAPVQDIAVAVIVHRMIESEVSGIAFSTHPVTHDANEMIIEAVLGLGETIVSGMVTPDTYIVRKSDGSVVEKRIERQTTALRRALEGGNEQYQLTPQQGQGQKLSDESIVRLTQLVSQIENYYKFPVDVEWAQEGGRFVILQSRPITALVSQKFVIEQYQGGIPLKPTVKRDISLISVMAWERGYGHYLQRRLDWKYNILFHYDGTKVSFYHMARDFDYFKKVISPRVASDDRLFQDLDRQFNNDIEDLRTTTAVSDAAALQEVYERIASAMSFYIFIVSDKFIAQRPEAWSARERSEGILYELDERVETAVRAALRQCGRSEELAHVMKLSEAIALLRDHCLSATDAAAIDARRTGYIFDGIHLVTGMSFEEYCRRNHLMNPETGPVAPGADGVKEFFGSTAAPGHAKGPVRIVLNRADLLKVQRGDVVVSVMTNANYGPVLPLAAAIITDEGGVTSHAAIVSRELKKPCVIGTKIATHVLKDNDIVEVDADKGSVRLLG